MWISTLDWALIQTWQEMGIPLHVVLRGIDRAFDQYDAKPVKTRLVNTLFYCQQAVQENFAEYTQSRVGEAAEPKTSRPLVEREETEILLERFSRDVYRAHGQAHEIGLQELAGVFERALVRLNDLRQTLPDDSNADVDTLERDLQIVDAWITEAIQKAVGQETMKSWTDEAKRELRHYKKRVPADMFEKILRNYLMKRARQHFDLPPLSLFSL